MRCVGIAVLLMVCVLQMSGVETPALGQEQQSPDTTKTSDIYNPPRVITPGYEAGPQTSEEVPPGTEMEEPGTTQAEPDRTPGKPCATCSGGSGPRAGGGGDFSTGYLFANLEDINPRIQEMGISGLSEDILMVGGRGYARIGHLLIGGAGYGGSTETSGIPDCCARYARIEIAYGGVLLGLAVTQPRYDAIVGMLFGGGSVEIVRQRNSRSVAGWDEAWDIFDGSGPDSVATDDLNVTSKITAEFIALEPFVELKYKLLRFVSLGLSASYLNAGVGRGEWKLDGVSIPDSPESNIGGWSLRLGLHFGV
jgi:hypothetical protein